MPAPRLVLALVFSFPAAKDRGQDAGIAPAMQDGNDPYRVFVGRVGNEVIVNADETQRAGCQIRTAVAPVMEGNKTADNIENIRYRPIGGVNIVLGYLIPNLIEVGKRFRVESVPAHAGPVRRSSLFSRRRAKASSPSMGFTRPLFRSS